MKRQYKLFHNQTVKMSRLKSCSNILFRAYRVYLRGLCKRSPSLLLQIRQTRPSIAHLDDKETFNFAARLFVLALQQIKKANNVGIAIRVSDYYAHFWTWTNPYRIMLSRKRYELYKYRMFANPNRKTQNKTILKNDSK